ncbi:glycosyltransferase family 4 protein [Myxococcota bacterium]|nr:glycosyltransferase family 4 protein [Myxococcota bacterium]
MLASRLPFPTVGGDKLRVRSMLAHLARRHDVTLLSFVEREEERAALAGADFLARVRTVTLGPLASRLRAAWGLASSPDPLQVHYYRAGAMARIVEEELATGTYRAALAHMVRMAGYVLGDPRVPVAVDLQDALSLNYRRARGRDTLGPWRGIYAVEAPRIARYEDEVVRRADASMVVSPVDREWLRRRVPGARIEVVGNGVDPDRFAYREGGRDRDRIVLVGHMRTAANQDMAIHFARDVLPRVQRLRPRARFHVVGAHPTPAVRRLHDGATVFVTPGVPDVLPLLHASAVSVCPMRLGAGVQNKLLESMAAGTPVVSTSIGLEGIPARPGEEAVVADDAEAFAREVVALMDDEARATRLAREARRLVEEKLAWGTQLAALDGLLDELKDTRRRGRRGGVAT